MKMTMRFGFAILLAGAAMRISAGEGTPSPVRPPWASRMREIERVYGALLVDLSSDDRYRNPANFPRIDRGAKSLATLAASLKGGAGSPDADPSIGIIASQFADEAEQANRALASGYRGYARGSLRSLTAYCLACHTRTASGPSFTAKTIENPVIDSLQDLEKANYLASIRQFDRSLDEYERIVADPKRLENRPFDWEKALRAGLAVAVRVKKDPERAARILEKALASPGAPYYLREQAAQWKLQLQAWKAEKSTVPATEDAYHAEAVRLMTEAKSRQRYPSDRSADVLYLRASAVAHDLLGVAPNGVYSADALYLAGQSYEVLRDLGLWEIQGYYFLACIYRAPHTEKARQCYRSYEEDVYLGYTGSGGTRLPAKAAARLKALEELARPLDAKMDPPRSLQ